MRRFIDLVESRDSTGTPTILMEAQDYMAMFSPILKVLSALKGREDGLISSTTAKMKDQVRWAREKLKRNDRVVWYLRLARFVVAKDLLLALSGAAKEDPTLADLEKLAKDTLDKLSADLAKQTGHREPILPIKNLQNSLEHYLSLPINEITSTVFHWQNERQLFDGFRAAEKKWQEQHSEAQKLIPYDDSDVVMKFNDGFQWVLLPRGFCRDEANAMGHCGNAGARHGDRILSLRRIVKYGGERYWRPSLTFILDKNGYLGEMKGRANEKPQAKYHKYIVPLIMDANIIKGIKGGGYMPENNFSLVDLPEAEQDALFEKRPELATCSYYFKKKGLDDTLKQMLCNFLGDFTTGGLSMEDWVGDNLVVQKFNDWADVVDTIGDKDAEYYKKVMESDEHLDFDVSEDDVERLLDYLPTAVLTKIKDFMRSEHNLDGNHDDNDEDYDNDEEYDLDRTSDLRRAIEDLEPEIYQSLQMAVETGLRHGTEREISEAMEKAFQDYEGADGVELMFILPDGLTKQFTYDVPVAFVLAAANATKLTDDQDAQSHISYYGWKGENKLEIKVPYYGFNEYDENDAIDAFLEENDQFDVRPKLGANTSQMTHEQKLAEIKELAPIVMQGPDYIRKDLIAKAEAAPNDHRLDGILYDLRQKYRNRRR